MLVIQSLSFTYTFKHLILFKLLDDYFIYVHQF